MNSEFEGSIIWARKSVDQIGDGSFIDRDKLFSFGIFGGGGKSGFDPNKVEPPRNRHEIDYKPTDLEKITGIVVGIADIYRGGAEAGIELAKDFCDTVDHFTGADIKYPRVIRDGKKYWVDSRGRLHRCILDD